MRRQLGLAVVASTVLFAESALAQTEIQWWHAFTGRLGDLLAEQVDKFNASQSDYKVVASHKGNYSETLNAGVAAFRAQEQPHILQIFEVGTATMMGAEGAVKPVYEVMEESGKEFDPEGYLAAVKGYYTTTDGRMLSLPYNSSTPVLYVNRDALSEAGIDPDVDLSTWQQVGEVLDQLKAAGHACPLTTAWQSWVHLENFSAYHDVPFASQDNGFAGLDTELAFNGPVQVAQHSRPWAIGPRTASSSMPAAAMREAPTSGPANAPSSPSPRLAMPASSPRQSSTSRFGRCLIGRMPRVRRRIPSSAGLVTLGAERP